MSEFERYSLRYQPIESRGSERNTDIIFIDGIHLVGAERIISAQFPRNCVGVSGVDNGDRHYLLGGALVTVEDGNKRAPEKIVIRGCSLENLKVAALRLDLPYHRNLVSQPDSLLLS